MALRVTACAVRSLATKCSARGVATSAGTHHASSARKIVPVVTGLALGTGFWMYADQKKAHARNFPTDGALMYPASSNFPDLSNHNNIMAKHLTPAVCYIFIQVL